jgi:hypothetical protein
VATLIFVFHAGPDLEGEADAFHGATLMRVALYGAGQVSTNVARVLARRPWAEVLGPFGRDRRDEALGSGADVVPDGSVADW